MMTTLRPWMFLLTTIPFIGACGGAAPAPPEVPKKAPVVAEPEPAPPPKCEALKDACVADAETRLPIPGTNYLFAPPEEWTYAKLEEATVAMAGEAGAVLVLTGHEPPKSDAKKRAARAKLLADLAQLVGVAARGKVSLRTPKRQDVASLKMLLWEHRDARRADAKGALLVVASEFDGGSEFFAIGFAPSDDRAGTEAILHALTTLSANESSDEDAESEASSEEKTSK